MEEVRMFSMELEGNEGLGRGRGVGLRLAEAELCLRGNECEEDEGTPSPPLKFTKGVVGVRGDRASEKVDHNRLSREREPLPFPIPFPETDLAGAEGGA